MAGPSAAKPRSFMLKMRLVAPDGAPFADKSYRVMWGTKLYPPAPLPARKTDKDGALSMLLEGGPTAGELQVIDRDPVSGKETVVWSIPLQIADDPPAAALPAIEPMPAPPADGATDQQTEEYEKELVRYRARVLAPIREHMQEFLQEWDAVRNVVTTMPLPPSPTTTDDELWAAWVVLSQAYALVSAGYEAAWRLWNLADLPLDREPSFPLMGSDVEKLQRSVSRFARRRGPGSGVPLIAVPGELDKLKEIHDKRGSLNP